MSALEEMIAEHEGLRLKPYQCSANKLTIGYGRNLDDRGITSEEALQLLRNDIDECYKDLFRNLLWFADLDQAREYALVDMCFNLGIGRLLGFRKMLTAMEMKNYPEAAKQALDSKWAKQVGRRAKTIAKMIETGEMDG